MKRFILLCLVFLLLASCATLKDDICIASDLSEELKPQLDDIEQKLVKQIIAPNQTEMQEIAAALSALAAQPTTDKNYLSRTNALTADYYWLQKNTRKAETFADAALKQNAMDEYALLVKMKCMKKLAAIEYASSIAERFPNYFRTAAFLGHLFFTEGSYQEAVVYFDKSLQFLPKVYSDVYLSERDLSYKKYRIGDSINQTTDAILSKDKILLVDMTTLTNENSTALNVITGNAGWKSSMIADRLKAAGWYRPDANVTVEFTARKDAAIFLWHLLCGSNQSKLGTYSNRYKTKPCSPIIDVPLGSEYFDAALAMVENDIMPLADGRSFLPEVFISGADFYQYLQKALEMK